MIRALLGLAFALASCRPTDAEGVVKPDVAPSRIRVAITVDDLPAHGPLPPGATRLEIHARLLAAFAAHRVPDVYGFVNAARVADATENRAALQAWVDAGHPLGNHTFSHPRMHDIGVPAYLAEIDRNEALLVELVGTPKVFRVFRYPFLIEGIDEEATVTVRDYLRAHDYRIAEVTIDFYDWAFNGPYVRCLAAGDTAAIEQMRTTFIDHGVRMLQWSDAAAVQMYGHSIPHVLLLHAGAFDAEMIDALLVAYENNGVDWITLDEALADPVYADVPIERGTTQGTLLDLMIEARGAPHPPQLMQPNVQLDALCRR